jgi:hypothetical protein
MKTEFFECSCYSDEHTLKFILDDDVKYPCLYTSIFLSEPSLLKRIWLSIKYIFGYKCKYGHFDCFLLREKDADRLIDLLNNYKALSEHEKQKA